MPTVVTGAPSAVARPRLWRITDRATFAALRRRGRRVRRGPVTLSFLAPPAEGPDTPPRVAFSVGRAAGSAVVRNRIRRRLRAALRERLVAGALPPGAYLLGATAEVATLGWSELVDLVGAAVGDATGTDPR